MTNHHDIHNPTIDRSDRRFGVSRLRESAGFLAGISATLVAGIAFAAATTSAAPTPGESTFVPIEPCRLMDTRPEFNVGDRDTPIGADETHNQQVTGAVGDCTLPPGISGVALNATAVDASAPTYVTFAPAGGTIPGTSNLNVVPDQPPTPNKVDVKTSADGKISIFNKFGTVDMVVDVTGYYSTATLDEMQQRLDQLTADMPTSKGAISVNIVPAPLGSNSTGLVSFAIPESFGGLIVANYAVTVDQTDAGETVTCGMSGEDDEIATVTSQVFESPGANGSRTTLSGARAIGVDPGEFERLHLVCKSSDGTASTTNAQITGIFTQPAG